MNRMDTNSSKKFPLDEFDVESNRFAQSFDIWTAEVYRAITMAPAAISNTSNSFMNFTLDQLMNWSKPIPNYT